MFGELFSNITALRFICQSNLILNNHKMSDSEDLLSYEIGDIDVHDDDLDAVEDQLLMSDDETLEESLLLNDDKRRPNTRHAKKESAACSSDSDKQIHESADSNKSTAKSCDDNSSIKKPASAMEKGQKKRILKRNIIPATVNLQTPPKQVKNIETQAIQGHPTTVLQKQPQATTSSNNGPTVQVDEETLSSASVIPITGTVTPPKSNKNQIQDACSLSELESPVASLIFSASGETKSTTSQDESCSCVEDSETESTSLTQQSQTVSSVQNSQESAKTDEFESDYGPTADIEFDDSDECSERTNAKLCVERDVSLEPQTNQQRPSYFPNQRGGMSHRGPLGPGPRPTHGFPHQFNSFAQRPNSLQFQPHFGPPMDPNRNLMMAPPQSGQRMEFRGRPPLNFRPPYQNSQPRGGRMQFTQHGHAVSRPNFQPTGPNNPPQFPPFINNGQQTGQMVGLFEPNGPMIYPPRPPFGCATSPFVVQPRHETMVPSQSIPPRLPIIVPRKVLINPNFKGGVQAAKNQLIMDTIGNPQFMSTQTPKDELSRQQDDFINQNFMQLEKRLNERSPDRDRERDRSYSPIRRERRYSRERDVRRPVYDRGGRGRRAGSREPPHSDSRPFMKRKRSSSLERDKLIKIDNKSTEPEDEETKKYRLEIEKQKSMREKILRDKEMRRRQAAEEKTKEEDKKPTEEATTKFTPIIVTEKKIISLKKKTDSMPLPKVTSDTKKIDQSAITSTHIKPVKPVLKMQTTQRLSDLEDYDEDELLADSPTPPISSTSASSITGGGMFTNRRVVLTSSADTAKQNLLHTTTADVELTTALAAASKSKGIFDRLDRKIAVNEAAKRRIQKIVINSNN